MKLIWIPHPIDAWVVAQVVSADAKSVTVRNKNGTEQTLPGALATFDLVTPDELETNYNNLVDMEAFNEGIILHQVFFLYTDMELYLSRFLVTDASKIPARCNIHICWEYSNRVKPVQTFGHIPPRNDARRSPDCKSERCSPATCVLYWCHRIGEDAG